MTHDEYHPDLRHEQDDQANAELHAQLERNCYEALRKVRWMQQMVGYQRHTAYMLTADEWSALLFQCGFKASDFE